MVMPPSQHPVEPGRAGNLRKVFWVKPLSGRNEYRFDQLQESAKVPRS
jgi:hypothetical protein